MSLHRYTYTPRPTRSTIYWTTQAKDELAVLIALVPLDRQADIMTDVEEYAAKARGAECINGKDVLAYFSEMPY